MITNKKKEGNQTCYFLLTIVVVYLSILATRDGRFGSKVGQIGPKWDKFGAFSDQISVHLARGAKCTEI